MIVEKIMQAVFFEGRTYEAVAKTLLSKVDLFLEASEGEGIQYVFDYCKLLDYKSNTGDIIKLAKIVAHFYNKGAVNTFVDDADAPSINERCIVPRIVTPSNKAHKFRHKTEGSFVKALGKALDHLYAAEKLTEFSSPANKLHHLCALRFSASIE